MYYIDNYRKRAVDRIIPYLIEFPQIIKILEINADRYQAIEDLIWKVADNFKVSEARGVFLNALAHNEVVDFIYTDKANDAFTYGTDKPLYQAYGTGHYYSQASYISGSRKNISEEKLIRAIQAKIIQNNTRCTTEDFLEAMKLLYNAEHVHVYESYPLNISLMLEGSKLEISSSGNYENIKRLMPATVSLNNIYLNHKNFNIFKYDTDSSYSFDRFPILIKDKVDIYNYISPSVKLNSLDEEFIKTNHAKLDINEFCCIFGEISDINDNAVIFSTNDTENLKELSLRIYYMEDGLPHIVLRYLDQVYDTNVIAQVGNRYTFILHCIEDKLRFYITNKINVNGLELQQDTSNISKILLSEPDITIDNYSVINGDIYINCINRIQQPDNINIREDFADFTYYGLIFGEYNNATTNTVFNEYYTTCYGEKHILFNCLENKNHLYINTNSNLNTNLYTKQSYFNYKENHSNGRYVYLDGKSNIKYLPYEENIPCSIDNFNIKFSFCCPIEINEGVILSNFINNYEDNSIIGINKDGKLYIKFKYIYTNEGEETEFDFNTVLDYEILPDIFYNIDIKFIENNLVFMINDMLVLETSLGDLDIRNISKNIIICSDTDNQNNFRGLIKDFYIEINGHDDIVEYNHLLNIPYEYDLKDKNNNTNYENHGVRIITTPQLISDTTNKDIYNNRLVDTRNY